MKNCINSLILRYTTLKKYSKNWTQKKKEQEHFENFYYFFANITKTSVSTIH